MALKHRGITRIGFVRIGLPASRLPEARAFYGDVLGLIPTGDSPTQWQFRCWHEPYKFSLLIDAAPAAALLEIGFQVRDADDLQGFATRLAQADVAVQWHDADTDIPGLGRSLTFCMPGGQTLRLFAEMAIPGYETGFDAPDWVTPRRLRGTPAPQFLNHVGLCVPDPAATMDFLRKYLDFHVSERIDDAAGQPVSALMFRMLKNVGGQELALFPGAEARLHHIAFTKDDASDILLDGQYLRNDGVRLDPYGPTRQPYGNTFSLHCFDPFGTRIELCTGGRLAEPHPEFQPVIWSESNLRAALSYYDELDVEPFLQPSYEVLQ